MNNLYIFDRGGKNRVLEFGDGNFNVMEVVRDSGSDELMAVCGGCCSCATCHIYVDPAFAKKLPPISAAEDALLAESPYRTAMSRLACQLPASNGLRIALAPED